MISVGSYRSIEKSPSKKVDREKPPGKAKSPGAHFNICLPLADIKRLSEDFVSAKYERFNAESNVND
jgi:hypothetical protein